MKKEVTIKITLTDDNIIDSIKNTAQSCKDFEYFTGRRLHK